MSDRKLQVQALSEFRDAEHNPKDHDIGAIIVSMQRFGLVAVPIVNKTTGRLVAGHGRVAALRAMQTDGATPPTWVQAVDGDWLVPYDEVEFETDAEARAYLLADNRLTEVGGWHSEMLLEALTGLADDDAELLLAAGFDGDYIDELAADLGVFDVDPTEPPSLDSGDRSQLQQITFTLHISQLETVKEAMAAAMEAGAESDVNTNKNGNAIAAVCQWYLQNTGDAGA